MKNRPLVSIIMNCHNGEHFLRDSINTIINQSYKNWELIFFDNCSTDNSFKVLKKIKNKKIKYFFSKKHLKLYHARNLAVKKAEGKYISFLDTDDMWNKQFLSTHVNKILKSKENIIYSKFLVLDETRKKKSLNYKKKLKSGRITQNLLDKYNIGILAVMLKRSIFKKYKFDKRYNIIGDFDFFIKLSMKYNFSSLNSSLATYRFHRLGFTNQNHKLHYNELRRWLVENEKKLKKDNYNLLKLKLYISKIKLKNYLSRILK